MPKENIQINKIKTILQLSRILAAIHYSSTKASSRPSEIGRTSISGSFSLLLSFGETKERREKNFPVKSVFLFFLKKRKEAKERREGETIEEKQKTFNAKSICSCKQSKSSTQKLFYSFTSVKLYFLITFRGLPLLASTGDKRGAVRVSRSFTCCCR
jgi:hypothetical protein